MQDLDADGQLVCGTEALPVPTIGSGALNAFNPCAPDPRSRTCHDYKPF